MSVVPSNDAAYIDYVDNLIRGHDVNSTTNTSKHATLWNKESQPDRATTVSRFHKNVAIPNIATHPTAHTVFSARCEVTSTDTCSPTSALTMASTGTCLSLAALGGYKMDRPVTIYWLPNPKGGELEDRAIENGLAHAVTHNIIDDTRKLIFLADKHRIKSFLWDEGSPVHTMRAGKYQGPLAVLPGGKLARAGKGYAAIWNLDALETHGGSGHDGIGAGTYEVDEYTYMDFDDIEQSTGSLAHTAIKFTDPDLQPSVWHLHQPTAYMLCAGSPGRSSSSSSKTARGNGFVSLDMTQGKTVSRYTGMNCKVAAFSTSDGDPNTFATAGLDGLARLYDIRQPSAQLKITADRGGSESYGVALAHPDGIPVLFTGGQSTESIALWDLRARRIVYELATGNNGVDSLAWDAANSTLYASTVCDYVDGQGNSYGCRPFKPPKVQHATASKPTSRDEDYDMEDDDLQDDYDDEYDDDDDDDDDDYDQSWPKDAFHSEGYFGYDFDAGDHRLYRYRFKEDSNLEILPKYGDATCGRW